MSDKTLYRFMGGSPAQVVLRLIFLSFVIGVILSALNLDLFSLIDLATRFVERIWNMGFDAISGLLKYFVMGAVIVVPIWLIMRLLAYSRGS